MARAAGSKLKTIGAVVPLSVYALAIEQAHREKVTLSNIAAKAIKNYLRRRGTTLEVA